MSLKQGMMNLKKMSGMVLVTWKFAFVLMIMAFCVSIALGK
jgi:hypothetical protein